MRKANSGSATRISFPAMEAVPPSGNHGLGQDASGHRAIDIDVLLSGLAGGCDLPAEQMCSDEYFSIAAWIA